MTTPASGETTSKHGWALVTGASAGLGVEFARQLAARGHDLVLVARRREPMEALAASLREERGVRVEVLELDLGARTAGQALEAALAQKQIELELLVNNAGFGAHGAVLELSIERSLEMVDLNIASLTDLALRFGKKMVARGRGAIVNVASIGGFQPTPHFAVYGATKAYVVSFSASLSAELSGTGVRVLCCCPGPTRTEFNVAGGVTAYSPPFLEMTAERCVRITLRALDRGRWVIVTGWINALIVYLSRRAPLWLSTRVSGFSLRPARAPSPRA